MNNFSEFEAQSSVSNFRIRKLLQDLIQYKREVQDELTKEDLLESRRIDLEEAIKMVDNVIARIRVSGIF